MHQVKTKKLIKNNAVNLQRLEELGGRNKASFQQTYCFVISDFILQSKNWILYYLSHASARSLADNGIMVHRQNDQ